MAKSIKACSYKKRNAFLVECFEVDKIMADAMQMRILNGCMIHPILVVKTLVQVFK